MWSDTCQSLYCQFLPNNTLLLQSRGRGIAVAVTAVQPRFVNGGPKRGSGWRVFPPSHGRKIFENNSCMKTTFSCTLNAIIRGSLCSGIDQLPTLFLSLFLFHLICLRETFSLSFFFFIFVSCFRCFSSFFLLFPFLLYSPINRGGGGGGNGPLVPPLATPVSMSIDF